MKTNTLEKNSQASALLLVVAFILIGTGIATSFLQSGQNHLELTQTKSSKDLILTKMDGVVQQIHRSLRLRSECVLVPENCQIAQPVSSILDLERPVQFSDPNIQYKLSCLYSGQQRQACDIQDLQTPIVFKLRVRIKDEEADSIESRKQFLEIYSPSIGDYSAYIFGMTSPITLSSSTHAGRYALYFDNPREVQDNYASPEGELPDLITFAAISDELRFKKLFETNVWEEAHSDFEGNKFQVSFDEGISYSPAPTNGAYDMLQNIDEEINNPAYQVIQIGAGSGSSSALGGLVKFGDSCQIETANIKWQCLQYEEQEDNPGDDFQSEVVARPAEPRCIESEYYYEDYATHSPSSQTIIHARGSRGLEVASNGFDPQNCSNISLVSDKDIRIGSSLTTDAVNHPKANLALIAKNGDIVLENSAATLISSSDGSNYPLFALPDTKQLSIQIDASLVAPKGNVMRIENIESLNEVGQMKVNGSLIGQEIGNFAHIVGGEKSGFSRRDARFNERNLQAPPPLLQFRTKQVHLNVIAEHRNERLKIAEMVKFFKAN